MAQQFGDLPQIPQNMDDSRFTVWGADHNSYVQTYKQQVISFSTEEDIYFDNFDNGVVSMQPMQRFMLDQCPLTPGLLNAKIPLQFPHDRHYEQQWPSADCFRNVSPDRTSASGNSSYATQNELCSPHAYHSIPYGSPTEYSQPTLPYPSTEIFHDRSYMSETAVLGGSISLRELEYEHPEPEPEPVIEESDSADMKQEAVCNHDHSIVKMETASSFKYADSGIGNSVRDAESVQPIDFYEEPASDSDYSPSSSRSGKRRRSSASNGSSGRTQRRRGHGRKDSQVSSPSTSTRPPKKARGASNASRGVTETATQPDDRRPFPCPLAGYGCVSNFSSKNEWKRHVSTQHIKLRYWRCDLCPPTTDPNDEQTFYYNDFNRKDLFTQHLRRMHAAPKDNSSRNQKEFPVTEDNLQEHQERCFLSLRTPPQQSTCLFCDRTFNGPTSWEERMEHVGRHLEKDRKPGVDMFDVTAWNMDQGLEQYLVDEGLIVKVKGEWKIGDGKPRRHIPVETDNESEEE
ncbi:Nn.00g054440.m01.CDS01 [Neocucurbitaria sp. VM-36]